MNILIIDDHQIIEEGTKSWLLEVVPAAKCYFVDNVRSALRLFQKTKMDLVLCDLEFRNDPKNDGFSFIESVLSFEPRTKAIAYTGYESYRIMKKAKSSGFLSFLNKGCTFEDFKETITNVLENGNHESEIMKELLKKRYEFVRSIFNDSIHGITYLSEKELKLTLLAKDTTDRQEIAKIMNIEPSTVDSHFLKITDKLNLKHRQDVAFFSREFEDELLKTQH
jgi:DNA-binding NarL/FixJ family response regulator